LKYLSVTNVLHFLTILHLSFLERIYTIYGHLHSKGVSMQIFDMIWSDIYIYIYIYNCNSVETRWQQYSSHLQKTVQQYSTRLNTKQYSSTVHIYTQRAQQYSTHLHTNSTHNTHNRTHITITKLNVHNNIRNN
jgi:hypothetical protein